MLVAAALIISISIHEFAHAYVAQRLGDDTAYLMGRVTLNPASHLDPVGTVLLLVAGFGWGRPVPFNPYNLENPKRDSALISLAGPASNFTLAIVLALLFRVLPQSELLAAFLYTTILYNTALGIFNLIPINPLDGFKVFNGLLPDSLSEQWVETAPYGMYILLFLVFTGMIGRIIQPLIRVALGILGF